MLVHISMYVDDVLISLKIPFKYLDMLKKIWNIKTNLNLTRYLGIDILQQSGILSPSAEKYINEGARKSSPKGEL